MFFSLLVLLILFSKCNCARELIATHIVSRTNEYMFLNLIAKIFSLFHHGERSPTRLYPLDPNDISFWSNGLGSLTLRGKFQHIHLGQYFRERYSILLNSTYVASEIYVRSSDYDRTLISAYLSLLGLYPSSKLNISIYGLTTTNNWPESLPWQPIPVHTVHRSIDHLLGVSDCTSNTALVQKMKKSERIQNINNEFRDIYNITPSCVNSTVLHQLKTISDIAAYYLMFMPEINRLRGGPLLLDILNNSENVILNKSIGRKAKIYSGHGETIVAILSHLGVNYPHQPPHASALFFDLYRQDNHSYDIQLEYLNMTNGRIAHPIKIPGCDNVMCSIATFKSLIKDRLPKDIDKECQTNTMNGT